jgi:predicted homoserine dehydrogenase-like protein
LNEGALPIGLAHKVALKNDVAAGDLVRWSDVTIDPEVQAVKIRREAEAMGVR